MHYTVKMIREDDGLVADSVTDYFPDAATALAVGVEFLIESNTFDDNLDANERPEGYRPPGYRFEVIEDHEAEAECDRLVEERARHSAARAST